jgi:hypothetical protein
MKHSKYDKLLKNLVKGPININNISKDIANNLIKRKLAKKKIIKKVSYKYNNINAPRWAYKYKFTRKRHNVIENINKNALLVITSKGIKYCRNMK